MLLNFGSRRKQITSLSVWFFFLPLHTSPKLLQSQEKRILKSGFVFTLALTELWLPLSPQPPMDFRWSPLGTTWNSEDLGGGQEKSLEAQKGSRGGSRQAGRGARYCSWVIRPSFVHLRCHRGVAVLPGTCNMSCVAGTNKKCSKLEAEHGILAKSRLREVPCRDTC